MPKESLISCQPIFPLQDIDFATNERDQKLFIATNGVALAQLDALATNQTAATNVSRSQLLKEYASSYN